MILPQELKNAISKLPSAEKDKLIFRLLKKDLVLANRLLFELVDDSTIEEEREKIKEQLEHQITRITQYYYSPGYLLMEVRELSGLINEHVSVTKDKYGEAWLNLFMLNKVLEISHEKILTTSYQKAEKLCVSVIARVFKIMLSINKLHEDYFIEFREDLEKLGNLISHNPHLMDTAIHHGLDINWLISGNIPEGIVDIHRQIKENGFLK